MERLLNIFHVLFDILNYLSDIDLCAIIRLNSSFAQIFNDNLFWRLRTILYIDPRLQITYSGGSYRQFYIKYRRVRDKDVMFSLEIREQSGILHEDDNYQRLKEHKMIDNFMRIVSASKLYVMIIQAYQDGMIRRTKFIYSLESEIDEMLGTNEISLMLFPRGKSNNIIRHELLTTNKSRFDVFGLTLTVLIIPIVEIVF